MKFNDWLAARYTPIDVLALGAVASAIFVGFLSLAQGVEIVEGTEPIGLLVSGSVFLILFGSAIAYINRKNREAYYGTPLTIEWDNENGQIILDESLAIRLLAYPDGFLSDPVTSFSYDNLGDGVHGWYVEGGEGEEEVYFELCLGDPE